MYNSSKKLRYIEYIPVKLYRYSELIWLERSLRLGEFRLRPATDYRNFEGDIARQDDELVRVNTSPASAVIITNLTTGETHKPDSDVTYRSEIRTNYLAMCFSYRWDEKLFDEFHGTDACLVIHSYEEFSERIHVAAEAVLPNWVGHDAPVVYGGRSEYGTVFSKPARFITQHEWRFAWGPPMPVKYIDPIKICIGNIQNIAEIVKRPRYEPVNS